MAAATRTMVENIPPDFALMAMAAPVLVEAVAGDEAVAAPAVAVPEAAAI